MPSSFPIFIITRFLTLTDNQGMTITRWFMAIVLSGGFVGIPMTAFAEEMENSFKFSDFSELSFFGVLDATVKNQSDYHTPLDGLSTIRHGANNRSNQISRTSARMAMVTKAGKQHDQGNDWYQLIGIFSFEMSPDDPDHPDTEDGQRRAEFDQQDTWIRYAPHVSLGITMGSQTIKATANAAYTHFYLGDLDEDFLAYTLTAIRHKPGISFDVHLSQELEFGGGILEGMSPMSEIGSLGSSSEAANSVVWSVANFSWIGWNFAYQSIQVGGIEMEINPVMDHYKREFTHSVLNASIQMRWQDFKPYLGYQTLRGKSVQDEKIDLSIGTIGIQVHHLGPGNLAMDYSVLDTPSYGKTGSVPAFIGLKDNLLFNYDVAIGNGSTLAFFAHRLQSKKDMARTKEEARLRNEDVDNPLIETLEDLEWTNSTSIGIAFRMRFKS